MGRTNPTYFFKGYRQCGKVKKSFANYASTNGVSVLSISAPFFTIGKVVWDNLKLLQKK